MAFLRSVARCNSLVSKKLASNNCIRSGIDIGNNNSRAELLANHRYYIELRRELKTLCNNALSASSTATTKRVPSPPPPAATSPVVKDPLDVSFNDPHSAFKSKTTWELIRAYVVYLMCSSNYLVDNNMKVIIKIRKKKLLL